jgi:hypothetical protein
VQNLNKADNSATAHKQQASMPPDHSCDRQASMSAQLPDLVITGPTMLVALYWINSRNLQRAL